MKPSDFTMNSDYLSIAQTARNEYTVYVGGGTLVQDAYSTQNFDFASTEPKGAVDRVYIKKDSGNYTLGALMAIFPATDVWGSVRVYRTSATNLRVQVVLENHALSGSVSYPAMTFKIKVASFEPPNVF